MSEKRPPTLSSLGFGLLRIVVALGLGYKILVANRVEDTVAQDPMILWVGLGVALLLLDARTR